MYPTSARNSPASASRPPTVLYPARLIRVATLGGPSAALRATRRYWHLVPFAAAAPAPPCTLTLNVHHRPNQAQTTHSQITTVCTRSLPLPLQPHNFPCPFAPETRSLPPDPITLSLSYAQLLTPRVLVPATSLPRCLSHPARSSSCFGRLDWFIWLLRTLVRTCLAIILKSPTEYPCLALRSQVDASGTIRHFAFAFGCTCSWARVYRMSYKPCSN